MVSLTVGSPGPINATTDPDTGHRTYNWQGRELPSVTTVKSMAGMSYNLHRWALNCVIDRAVDQNASLNRLLASTDEASIKAAKEWLFAASTEERDRAADLGTRIHDAASKEADLARVAADVHPQLKQFYGWIEQEKPTILYREKQVFNLALGYAGTFDLMAETDDGLFIVDIKTGKSTFPEHALQLLAYSMGEFIGENDVIDPVATDHLLRVQGIAILHLQKTQWKWQEILVKPEMAEAYEGLLKFASWSEAHRGINSVVATTKKGSA